MRKGLSSDLLDPKRFDPNNLVQTFGNPPYEFLNPNNPESRPIQRLVKEKVIKGKRAWNTRPTDEKAAMHPGPNWFNMKNQIVTKGANFNLQISPEYFQEQQIHNYDTRDGSRANDIFNNIMSFNSNEPGKKRNFNISKAAFWIKSRRSKNFIKKPQPGDSFDMMTTDNQVQCTAVVDQCFIPGNARSGHVILRDFKAVGPVKDISQYKPRK